MLLPVVSTLVTAAAMIVVVGVLGRRAGAGAIGRHRCRGILAWGVLSGVVAFGFAFGLELCVPHLLGSSGYFGFRPEARTVLARGDVPAKPTLSLTPVLAPPWLGSVAGVSA